jgi:biopolymer transport protein ExbD
MRAGAFLVALAAIAAAPLQAAEPRAVVTIREDAYLLNGEAIESLDSLRDKLPPEQNPNLIVAGDACTNPEHVSAAIETIKSLGYGKVVLETQGLFQDAECALPPKRRWWRRSE